mgnify:CR=1 FL=1|tara:strand:- start:1012 stop:1959 length:948 start_codon:yes stop_codon:yes gene_type:complete
MTFSAPQNCTSCASSPLKTLHLRDTLIYYVCPSCRHCEKAVDENSSINKSFEDAQEKYFGEDSAIFQVTQSPFEEEVLAKRIDVLSRYLPQNGSVIEVGPGGGAVLNWLIQKGHQPIAIEHSPSLSDHLAQHYKIAVKTGEFETLDMENKGFDAFCSFHVIEHVRDPMAHLGKAFSAVRPGGMAFVATPNARSWEQRIPGHLSPNYDSAHLRVFSPESLSKLAQDAGWHVQEVITPEFTMGWLRVLSKIVRRIKGEHEESTAGKYAGTVTDKQRGIYRVANLITMPVRAIQARLGGGNELFFVLQRPDIKQAKKS